ncbi:TPR repeat-containing protein [Geotalea uraniireducens Rf4]|uniref:TPR repeat-containing protein n=2 Tax=Geotalea uraniireducens TaxID=351604 RepID=A5G628_GEOUR|nr:TPR repeat-containing protein [Geotalea uraniireducens Rf4]
MATIAGYLLLAIGLSLLVGCATAGKAKVEPAEPTPAAAAAAAEPSPSLPAGPSVVHFTDGREGFLITEPSGMDAQLRADFDQASAMIKEAKFDKAIELLEKVIAQSPEMTAPHINLAIAYRQINKPEQAEQHLKKALELIPVHPVASNEYGLMLRKAGRFAESRLIYEKSLAAFPEYHPIHKNLAILCDLYLKDLACAVEHYEIYGQAMPKDQQVKLWLADLQTRRPTASAGMGNGLSVH